MKNIVIFEGIASSGKTTLEKLLVEKLHDDVAIISEGETLMPIIDNKEAGAALVHLQKQLEAIHKKAVKNIIIDRFHFTHAFRTKSEMSVFSSIEYELQKEGNILTALLVITPGHIKGRIEESIQYRKDDWKNGAQGSVDEKVVYYTNQQERLKEIATSSRLPLIIVDTTAKDWETYSGLILSRINSLND